MTINLNQMGMDMITENETIDAVDLDSHDEKLANNVDGKEEKQEVGRVNKAVAFVKRHGLELILGTGCVALSVVTIRQGKAIALKDKIISMQRTRIDDLVALCEEKDAWFKALMSDALKHRSSFAGKCMVDRRELLNGK